MCLNSKALIQTMPEKQAQTRYTLYMKQQVEVVVENEKVSSVIDAIAEAAKTGEIGDGKIFISSIDSVVRIRTGDTDEEAL